MESWHVIDSALSLQSMVIADQHAELEKKFATRVSGSPKHMRTPQMPYVRMSMQCTVHRSEYAVHCPSQLPELFSMTQWRAGHRGS